MRNLLFVYLLIFISCNTKNRNIQVNEQQFDTVQVNYTKNVDNYSNYVSVFLDYEYTGEVYIFDKSHHIIRTVNNDLENENIVMFKLLEKNDSMFFVVAYWALDEKKIAEGWIYKSNHLGIFSAAYARDFVLYEEPYDRNKIVVIDNEYNPEMYEVIDFKGRWLKIKARIENKFYEGWIPPEMQCSNVYSTCN